MVSEPEAKSALPVPEGSGWLKLWRGELAEDQAARWLGEHPEVSLERWRLTVDGACEQPVTLDWGAFQALEQVADTSDFHCVTTWSRMDIPWVGVRLAPETKLTTDLPRALIHMTLAPEF